MIDYWTTKMYFLNLNESKIVSLVELVESVESVELVELVKLACSAK